MNRRDQWSFLFGQIAVHSFIVLLLTGAFLTVFYDPDMSRVTYDGSYGPLRGVEVSRAYESTVALSLDVRGGLLMRQIHHWAALIFTAAICCALLRMFLNGAHRLGRLWLIWVTLLPAAMVAGVTGSLLPDDMLSGGSLSLIQGITQSIPVVGTWLTYLVFDGDFPGDAIIPRAYWVHIAVLPPIIAAMLFLGRRALPRIHRSLVLAIGLFAFGTAALLGTFAQINPIWTVGPFEPGAITAGAVPGWYMGFLDGAVRIMPGWEFEAFGYTLTLAVLVPALIVPGAFFTVLALYPWVDRRFGPFTGNTRTGIAAAGVTFYGLLWAAAANDQMAVNFHLELYTVTWFFRIAILVGPVLAFVLTRSLSLAFAHRRREEAEHGRETGRIVMSPDGAFTEIHTDPSPPMVGASRTP